MAVRSPLHLAILALVLPILVLFLWLFRLSFYVTPSAYGLAVFHLRAGRGKRREESRSRPSDLLFSRARNGDEDENDLRWHRSVRLSSREFLV